MQLFAVIAAAAGIGQEDDAADCPENQGEDQRQATLGLLFLNLGKQLRVAKGHIRSFVCSAQQQNVLLLHRNTLFFHRQDKCQKKAAGNHSQGDIDRDGNGCKCRRHLFRRINLLTAGAVNLQAGGYQQQTGYDRHDADSNAVDKAQQLDSFFVHRLSSNGEFC